MGWFKLPDGETVLGDDPADLMQDALPAYAAAHGKPALRAFLGALARVLASDAAELVDGPGLAPGDQLRARLGGAAADLVAGPGDADPELVRAVEEVLAAVAASYVQGQGRRCRLKEILGTVVFSFGRLLSQYFSDCDGLTLKELVPEPA